VLVFGGHESDWPKEQALEAVKLAAGIGKTLSRRLLLLDALDGRMHTVKLRAR